MHCNPQGNSNSTGYNLNPTTINNNVFIIYYFHFMYNTKSIYSVQTKNSSTLLSPNDTQLTVSEADTKRSLLGPEFSCLGPKTPSSPAVPFATSVKNNWWLYFLCVLTSAYSATAPYCCTAIAEYLGRLYPSPEVSHTSMELLRPIGSLSI